jgi:hypothetical protein
MKILFILLLGISLNSFALNKVHYENAELLTRCAANAAYMQALEKKNYKISTIRKPTLDHMQKLINAGISSFVLSGTNWAAAEQYSYEIGMSYNGGRISIPELNKEFNSCARLDIDNLLEFFNSPK